MPDNSILATTEIIIQDFNNGEPIVFKQLFLTESLLSVNNFSFLVRPLGDDPATLSAAVDFKKEVLGKDVEINFKTDDQVQHKFKGVILKAHSSLVDNTFYEFKLEGTGSFGKLNEAREYRSFYKKKLDAILDGVFQNSALKSSLKKNPQNTKELHYTVQYNQTAFAFTTSLAVRFGEWLFYDGEQLQFGKKPEGTPIELVMSNDVNNVNIKAQAVRVPKGMVGTDIFKSSIIEATTKEQPPGEDFIKAAESSGSKALEEASANMFIATSFSKEVLDDKFKLEQQAILSSSVFITGNTRNTRLSVGKIIKIKDAPDAGGKNYILTQVTHTATDGSNYVNDFTAVPEEVPVPPYVNPLWVTRAAAQPAVVTDNEDDAGLARVKVKFPWMRDDEKTPWISVLAPHAGTNKGFRFLPEVDDEVMVSFLDGNVETPFVNGAVYTHKNQPGIAEAGNHLKRIGSRTGRRFEIHDDEGYMLMADNLEEYPKNILRFDLKDGQQKVGINSAVDGDNYSAVIINNQEDINIGLASGGNLIAQIRLIKEGPKILIDTKGDIEVKAEGKISMEAKEEVNISAPKININAKSELNLESSSNASLSGAQVKIDAQATLEAKGGASAKLEGAMLDLKGSGVANLQGALVKIN